MGYRQRRLCDHQVPSPTIEWAVGTEDPNTSRPDAITDCDETPISQRQPLEEVAPSNGAVTTSNHEQHLSRCSPVAGIDARSSRRFRAQVTITSSIGLTARNGLRSNRRFWVV